MGFDVKTDYYKILDVDQNATAKEIHKGFQKQAKKSHPDKNLGDSSSSTKKFQALSQAYDVLKDPDERSKYDKARRLEGSDKAVNTASSSSKMQPPFFTHPPSATPSNKPPPSTANRGAGGYKNRTSTFSRSAFGSRKTTFAFGKSPNGAPSAADGSTFPSANAKSRHAQKFTMPKGKQTFSPTFEGEGTNAPRSSQTSQHREQKPSRSTPASDAGEAQVPSPGQQTSPGHNPSVSTGANTASQHARPTADPPNRANGDAMSSECGLGAKSWEEYHLPELLIPASPKPPGPASNSYHAEMNTYAVKWNAWEGSMLNHFEARHRSYASELPLRCIKQMGQCYGIIYDIYSQGKLEDMKARYYWLQQEEEHLYCMEHFWGAAADPKTHFPSPNDPNIPKPPPPPEYGQMTGYIQQMSVYIGQWNDFEFRVLSQLNARYHETPLILDNDYSIRYLERKREDKWLRRVWNELERSHLHCMAEFWQMVTERTS